MKRGQRQDRDSADVGALVAEYVHHASTYGRALSEGNSKQANKSHAEVTELHRMLRARGEAAQRELLGLLEHPDLAVRSWAATHALEFAPECGVPVLEKIAEQGPVPLCLSAEFTLERWREGSLPHE